MKTESSSPMTKREHDTRLLGELQGSSREPSRAAGVKLEDRIEAARFKVRHMLHAADNANHIGEMAVLRMAASADLLEALEAASAGLHAMPHGDNCFLHSDGGEYDRCFCGKDSLANYVDDAIAKGSGQ